jgi:hypothetical protein
VAQLISLGGSRADSLVEKQKNKRETTMDKANLLKVMFGIEVPLSRNGMLVCQNDKCQEKYHVDHIATVSDDQLMGWLKGGGATVIGEMSGNPVLVGHSDCATSESDLKSLLNDAPKVGWQCNKCKTKNSWSASYSPEN